MLSNRASRALRRQVADRAQWRCEYGQSPAAFSTQSFEVDHIIPRRKNSPTVPENLALACGWNSYKGERTPARGPQTGRTATGRATVVALNLALREGSCDRTP